MRKSFRIRFYWLFCVALLIAAGLLARKNAAFFPRFLADYLPDTIWAMMVYCGFGVLLGAKAKVQALCALCFAWGIEFSQLYHAPWIDAVRSTTIGHLVLGTGFLWSDLICYAAGITICFALHAGCLLGRKRSHCTGN